MAHPSFVVQVAFANNPGDTNLTWVDITSFVLDFHLRRGKIFELDRFDAGTCDIRVDNRNRTFEPTYPGSPFYPNVLPMKPIRILSVLNGVTRPLWLGYVERWPQQRKGKTWGEVTITASDGFEPLSHADVTSNFATYTTAQGSNKDLTFTAVARGYPGNSVTIAYVNGGASQSLSVSVSGLAVTVNLATDGSSVPTATASQIMTAINANANAQVVLTASIASGQTGNGIPAAFAAQNLAGANYVQQLSGARINALLDSAGWPSAMRNIDAGYEIVQAEVHQPADGHQALNDMQVVEQSELGWLFMDASGRVRFIARQSFQASPYTVSQATFSDRPSTTEYPYVNVVFSWDKDKIFNDIQVTMSGGSNVQIQDDATSITQYFKRSLQRSPLVISDNAALLQAGWLLYLYKQPLLRVDSIEVHPADDTNTWLQVLTRELGDRVTVKDVAERAGPGNPIVQDVLISGIDLSVNPGRTTTAAVTYQLVPASLTNSFILDSASNGVLNSNPLAY